MTLPLSADAATGNFTYQTSDGKAHSLASPAAGKCLATPGAVSGKNGTNAAVDTYTDGTCTKEDGFVRNGGDLTRKFGSIKAKG